MDPDFPEVPQRPRKEQMTPREIEKFLIAARIPHAHLPDGRVVPARNRAERRGAGLKGKGKR